MLLLCFFSHRTMQKSKFPACYFPSFYCNRVCVSLLLVSILIFFSGSRLHCFALLLLCRLNRWRLLLAYVILPHLTFFTSFDFRNPARHFPHPPPRLVSEFQSPQPPTTANTVAILQLLNLHLVT